MSLWYNLGSKETDFLGYDWHGNWYGLVGTGRGPVGTGISWLGQLESRDRLELLTPKFLFYYMAYLASNSRFS